MNTTLLLVAAVWGQVDAGPVLGPPATQIIGDEPTPAAGLSEPPQPSFAPAPFNPNAPPRFQPQPTPAAPADFSQPSGLYSPRGEIAPASGIGEPRGVLPAGSNAPLVNRPLPRADAGGGPGGHNPSAVAEALLLDALKAPPQGALAGHRLSLLEALARTNEPARRLAVVKHYWYTACLLAEYHGALEESQRLQYLGQQVRASDRTAYDSAQTAADARTREAELNAVVAQYELAELAASPITETLPLPGDRPLVTIYGTKFDSLFAGRTPPLGLRRIDRTLPLRHGVILARASSLTAATQHLAAETESYRGGQTPLAGLLAAQDRVRENRSAFLLAVRQYNFDIAEYALSIASPGLGIEKIVGMLIGDANVLIGEARTPLKSVLVPNAGGVQPVSAHGPLGGQPMSVVAPAVQFESLPAGGRPIQPELREPALFQPAPPPGASR